jgi:hypothetical protein
LPTKLPTNVPTSIIPTVVPTLLSTAAAVVQCLAKGLVDNPLNPNDAFDKCVYRLTH